MLFVLAMEVACMRNCVPQQTLPWPPARMATSRCCTLLSSWTLARWPPCCARQRASLRSLHDAKAAAWLSLPCPPPRFVHKCSSRCSTTRDWLTLQPTKASAGCEPTAPYPARQVYHMSLSCGLPPHGAGPPWGSSPSRHNVNDLSKRRAQSTRCDGALHRDK